MVLLNSRAGLMARALDRVLVGDIFFLFLGKTIYSHIASLHTGIVMIAGEFNAGKKTHGGLACHIERSVENRP